MLKRLLKLIFDKHIVVLVVFGVGLYYSLHFIIGSTCFLIYKLGAVFTKFF